MNDNMSDEEIEKQFEEEAHDAEEARRFTPCLLAISIGSLAMGWFWLKWKYQLPNPFSGWFHDMID